MKDEAEKKQKLIEKFVEASLASYKAQEEGKARIVNRNYDKKVKIRAELKDDLENYKELFTPLLAHENAHVRLDAAISLLPVSTEEAEAVLEEVAKGPGLTAFTAEMTLREWRKGNIKNII